MLAFKSVPEPLLQVTEVNIFYLTLFSRAQAAELRFKVDGCNSDTHVLASRPTRVTRLERMVRGTNAFVEWNVAKSLIERENSQFEMYRLVRADPDQVIY